MAIVSIKTQQVTFYDTDGWILRAPVSTGTTGRETPAGIFAVLEKEKEHRSTLYDDAEMPNMQRITWNGIALHGGPLPGYAASHGCVRMPFGFAEKLFDKTRIGMRVIISPNDAEPLEFSHPALLVPKAEAIAAAPARAEALTREAAEAARMADEAKKAAASAPRETAALTSALRTAKQFITYTNGTPFQHAVAVGLGLEDAYVDLLAGYRRRRDLLLDGLVAAGLDAIRPQGAFWIGKCVVVAAIVPPPGVSGE